ncbi:response regulator [Caballeronia zhejiangensis]|uniref:response regulator n=2 Tax=Caballeronia TaxID=1827195 RepID=UPI0020295D77|nr:MULTISPECIES: response regulator [unclassified Caballeronia]
MWSVRSFPSVTRPVAVLIVDDDRAGAEALAAVLALEGFRTTVIEGGPQALRTPPTLRPHIVVLDIEMPVCDGFAVATAIRKSACFAAVPIIGYSSLDEAEVVERGREAQIDGFCRKGNTLHCLFELIEFMAPVGPAGT